jgi:hypothetical protein
LMRTFRRWSGLGLHPSWTFDRQFFFFTTYTVNYSRSHCVLCSRIKEFVLSFTTSLSGRGGRNASVQIKWGRKPKMIVSCVYACISYYCLSCLCCFSKVENLWWRGSKHPNLRNYEDGQVF